MDEKLRLFFEYFSKRNIQKIYKNEISHKTARGIDRIGIESFEKNKEAVFDVIERKCLNFSYKFSPYVEILKSKGKGKPPRVISIPTIRDRIVLAVLCDFLHEVYPECVNRKLPNNYIKEIKGLDIPHSSNVACLKVDISKFYDMISHESLSRILCARLPDDLVYFVMNAIQSITAPQFYRKQDKRTFNCTGVPQGLSISNILANIYLSDFDEYIKRFGIKYLRYVDDILMICEANELGSVESIMNMKLSEINLSVNEDKTHRGSYFEEFNYLGYRIGLPLVSVKKETVDRFLHSITRLFASYRYGKDRKLKRCPWLTEQKLKDTFLFDLNEKITGAISGNRKYGWIFYFIEITDYGVLYKIDHVIRKIFARYSEFTEDDLSNLKKISRAYHEAKHSIFGGYIHNYESYNTPSAKISYLKDRGYIGDEDVKLFSAAKIERLFRAIRQKNLSGLEMDIGLIS